MIQIVIIGAGQIGSRHLQALSMLSIGEVNIDVVDISQKSLDVAQARFEEMPNAANFAGKMSYYTSLDDVPKKIDFAFVTTTANVRRMLIEKLVEGRDVQHLILEKVLFQAPNDYPVISQLIKENGINTVVNFPRRQYPIYKDLHAKLETSGPIHMNMTGANWGLACNGLHMIDLFMYLTDSRTIDLSFNGLTPEIQESKRSNFLEVTGTITGTTADGHTLRVKCYDKGTAPVKIELTADDIHVAISESGPVREVCMSSVDMEWSKTVEPFVPLYQSQLSHLVVQDLLQSDNCDLPSYDEVAGPHLEFINGLISHFNKYGNQKYNTCPIT